MGVSMDFLMNLIQLGLDAGILALCCEVVFRQKVEIKAKDFFVFPILLVLCVVPRVDFSIGANMTASFRSEGFEILPADNIVGLLFLIFAVLLLSSIFFGSKSSGTVFCGTMAAFSIFLFVKCLCAVLFAVCGATDILLLLGSRIAALCLIVELKKELETMARGAMRNEANEYISLEQEKMKLSPKREDWRYVLFPVWTLTYPGKDGKVYYYAMNGQTGTINGDFPFERKKALLTSVVSALFVLIFMLVGGYFS